MAEATREDRQGVGQFLSKHSKRLPAWFRIARTGEIRIAFRGQGRADAIQGEVCVDLRTTRTSAARGDRGQFTEVILHQVERESCRSCF